MSENMDLELGDLTSQESAQQLLVLVNNEANGHRKRGPPFIYMAPDILRDWSPSSFNPRLVSIGPLHKEDKSLQAFEEKKVSCLNNLLNRINAIPKEDILESCMEKVYASMEIIRACYVFTKVYSDSEIAKMMVMDACFILEFIASYPEYQIDRLHLKNKLLPRTIVFDLVLLENQIPFFILDHIYECTIRNIRPHVSLVEFIHPVLYELHLFATHMTLNNTSTYTAHHILGLLHEYYKPHDRSIYFPWSSKTATAVDLDTVKLKPNLDPRWEMQIEVKLNRLSCGVGLWSKPILRLPVLFVHEFSEVILRNLIAYELSCETPDYVTSYACTMGMLVNTQEDVTKLVNSRVLFNDLGSNKEVADTINNVSKNVRSQGSFYNDEWDKLREYNSAYWPKNIAWLRRTYFSSPWNIIAFAAGIILFTLTIVQTIYSIKSAM